MCGRYTLVCIDDLGVRFRIVDPALGFRSHFNVAPSSMMPVIVRNERTEVVTMRWGLVSSCVKEVKGPGIINARAETLSENPVYGPLLEKNRCLVPASGFYEWKKEAGRTIPFYIHLKDITRFAFAGLYDTFNDADGMTHQTYTIITTEANKLVAPLHRRMPAILKREDEDRWLSGEPLGKSDLEQILSPYPDRDMTAYPVSTRVNNALVDDGQLILPLETL
jgi:putative SOS response-associated peptidase YedK